MVGSQAPGASSRGRGGKFRKFTRGGGKQFSRDLRPLDADGNEIGMWDENGQQKGSNDDSEESEDSEEESDDNAQPGLAEAASREARKKEKKARKEAAIARAKGQAVQVGDLPSSDDESDAEDLPANPNHSRAARSQTKAPAAAVDVDDAADAIKEMGLKSSAAPQSRRERESLEAQQAKERYRKLHEQGKTDEAKADLARLKLIREKREAEAARKQAEKAERDELEKSRKQEIDAREAKLREAALGKAKKGKK
ncbi:MAG: hypothetical protein SEPTF4163_003239 [Sporothrix epigloea]